MKILKSFLLLISIVFLTGCVAGLTPPGLSSLQEKVLEGRGKNKILVIEISGAIFDKEKKNFLGNVTQPRLTSRVREELDKAREDKNIKAVILRINSPGGAVTPCDMIYHEITKFKKETGVYVLAQFLSVSASGGYYIGLSADEIMAHPTTVTGAVGVISLSTDLTGLMEKIGVKSRTFKSGDKKDVGSPFRAMTKEDRAIYQSLIDELFDRFAAVLMESRPSLTGDSFKVITDGRILTAKQALKLGAIDSIGYMDDAIIAVKKGAKIKDATVITYGRSGSYKTNIFSKSDLNIEANLNLLNIESGLGSGNSSPFMYMWLP